MGEVIRLSKSNVQHVSLAQLKREWDLWMASGEEEIEKVPCVEFDYEQIHAELNRRGEGVYCAV